MDFSIHFRREHYFLINDASISISVRINLALTLENLLHDPNAIFIGLILTHAHMHTINSILDIQFNAIKSVTPQQPTITKAGPHKKIPSPEINVCFIRMKNGFPKVYTHKIGRKSGNSWYDLWLNVYCVEYTVQKRKGEPKRACGVRAYKYYCNPSYFHFPTWKNINFNNTRNGFSPCIAHYITTKRAGCFYASSHRFSYHISCNER